jgi:hypothetical protein
LYEGQFIMALSTTQSIWRSGGGDTTRTAYCGSGVMAASFYVANLAAASTTRAVVSSVSGAPALILPAGAVITEVIVSSANAAATKTFDMGFTLYTSGTANGAALINEGNANVVSVTNTASTTNAGKIGLPMSSTEMVYITAGAGANTPANGTVISGTILYYVTDPLAGQQNV